MAGKPRAVLSERPDEVEISGEARPLEEVAESVKNDPPASEPKPRFPARFGNNPGNYRITDADQIGTGTAGQRIRANMAAIRLVLELERENRYPTREEQSVLVKYVGWGGLKNVFKGDNSASKQEREAYAELKESLTPEQLFWMGQSVLNAHYTSPKVVGMMYRALEHFGVDGGRFLEPTVGSGNFIGLMPDSMASGAKWFASEIDPLTSLIAKNLYPDAQVLTGTGFQDAEFSYGRTDVAIGNPPFGDERITDTNKKRAEISGFKIHNYIIAKSAMHLRPGGIMEFVVTSRFLDTADSEARDFLQKNFRFLGAVRLPNDAFAGSAGTEVTTDILFLQRLRDGQREGDDTWLDTAGTIQDEDGETIRLNRYFAENPSMMLGKPSMQGTMYGSKEEFTLKPIDGMDIAEAFERILSRDWRGYQGIGRQRAEDREAAAVAIEYNREDVPIGGFYRDGERIVQRTDDDEDGNTQFRVLTADTPWTEKTTLGDTRLERIKGMMDLRDMAYDLMAAERSDAPQDQLDAKRASLVRRYDAFVAEHGYLNDPANRKLMDDDPRIEFGLEANYTKKISAADSKRLGVPQSPAKAEKTSLLRERVFFPKQEVLSADTPADGYAISLSEKGKLDLDYISELTGLSVDKVTASLSAGESPLIYRDPVLGRWVQEDEYLSGNVKDKLKMARGAGLEANIKALEAVQPVDVAPQDIHAEFGATWIRPSVYEDFLKLFGYTNPQVSVLPKSGAVEATSAGTPGASIFRADVENSDYSIVDVFSAAANRRQLIAYDGSGDDRHINPERTENLGRIRNKMIAIWRDWIKSDAERADLLARDYNEMMNTTVERKYDGVRHLRTVGANPAISLRNSQKDSSWRMIQSSVTLMDHVVGAGKTIAITTGLMERKRLGLSKKPMVVVPNHLVGQWARDWMALYPGANILAATEKDFAKANRRRLFARIATGKFDAIIVGHSSFGFIPVSSEAEVQFVMKEVEFLEDALTEAKTAESSKKGKGDSRRVRGIKNRIAKRMEKIKELQDKPRDNVVSFEDMGVDYLAVDEFHEFKNLEYATTLSNVAGMGSPEGSKKAFDLYMKLRLLQEWGGGVAGATGTPISNSLVEMYSLLRYLNPGALAARNLEQFDAWVKMYASIEPRDEYTAAGKIKQRTVLAAFNNLPELLQMYKQVADTVTMSDLKRITAEQIRTENRMKGESKREEFPVPKVKGGTRRLDIGAPTDEQVEFMDYLIARADILDKMKGKEKQAYAKIDNALWLMNDARKMSLDVRIIDPSVPDNKSNKVNRAARNIKEIYDRTDDDLGAQLVFCDLSTPAKNAGKDAKDFIRGMMKTLGFSDDAATASALDGKSYAEQWRYLKMRADMLLDGGDLNDAKRESIEGALEKVSDDNLSALQVADSGFSVYDALKTRLIDSGIPEREIAFIHDATTSDKKRELFDLVKAGRVRVLIGSSAKMGAGTNVQTRLVALHHMDAPWRPSDIEQREGRIIRQGNMFYDRDPDGFEVEIVAYSTERTFDAQMWGVLARKAAFLEQFRHGLRTITEEGSDADSYAEFMAEATGDQIFRQKIQLERELNDIEAEERSSKMKRQASESIVRTASEKQARLDARLAEAKTLAAADLSRVTFDGNAYRNDMYDVLQSETEAFRIENEAFQKAEEAYRITRKAWEDAAGTERGRAPQKPVKPEVPEIGAKRVVEKSEWARFVNALTRKFELIPEAMTRGFDVVAANGTVLPISVSRGSGESVFVTVGGNSVAYATPPRSSIMYASLTPNSIQGTTKGAPQRIAKEISSLAENVRQAQFTLDHVKAVSPEAVADVRNRYEAVKKAVDEASARMAEERAQRDNRFIGRDKTRFGEAAAASEVAAEAPKKIPDNVRFRKDGDSVVVEEKFKPLSLDGLDHEFFTVKNGKTWHVIESGSGLSAGNGDTREQAIGSANATLSRIGVEKFSEVIAKAPKITDSDKLAALSSKGGPAVLRDTSALPDTITVNGVERPTTNSTGKPIHPTEEGVRKFWEWFGGSKMTNKAGEPLLFMHGSPASFEAFDSSKLGTSSSHTSSGLGHFFTRDRATAEKYADGGNIYTGWLRIEKPYVMMLEEAQAFDDAAESAKRRAELQKQGYDGAVILDDEGKPWATVAFEPWQFKSTENNGDFDEFDDRMRFRDDPSSMRDATTVPRDQAEEFIRKFVAEYPGAPQIMLADSFYQLPGDIQSDALEQGSGPTRAKGALKNGKAYVVLNTHTSMADLEASVFHEVLGHTGIRKLLGPQFSQELNKLFVGLGGYSGLERIMQARGMGRQFEGYFQGIQKARASNPDAWTDALAKSILTEEVFAHIAEQRNAKQLRDRFMALVGMIRDWLRKHGFMELARLGESDIVFMLQHAREGLRDGSGIVRDGATVGENEIVGEDGRPIAKEGSPDYEALKLLSGRLGLRERSGPTVFKDEPAEEAPAVPTGDSKQEAAVFRTDTSPSGKAADDVFLRTINTAGGRKTVRDHVAEAFSNVTGESAKTFNWWQRTVGSQYGKAKSDKDFGRVYDAAHAFLDGVSAFAKEASERASGILPHLDTWRDVSAGLNVKKQWADSQDYQAIAPAIFDGTLANGTTGKVWTDEQLRDKYNLNDKQIGHYREFRAAVDFSLETLAASEMARMARASKMDAADRDMGMDDALSFYLKQLDPRIKAARDAVEGKGGEIVDRHTEERAALEEAAAYLTEGAADLLRNEMQSRHDKEIDEVMGAERSLENLRASFTEKVEQIRKLQSEGYAPLMRFGQYTVDVARLDDEGHPLLDEDGNPDRPFFGMFESESEARKAEKILTEEYPGYSVTRGVLSTEANQLYRGLTPETAEMFARLLGTDENEAFQAYLKQAVANRSAMKRLINRMGIEGFATDVPRVLSAFITSNARLSSGNWYFGEMSKAVEAIPKHKGDVKTDAVKLMQYVQNPVEEAAGLRGFLFFSFLGGSVASAVVNLTQTFTTTLPYLSQFGAGDVAKALPKAMALSGRMMKKGLDAVSDKDLKDALRKASDEGVVDPQEIHLLMAEAGGNGASVGLSGLAGAINKEWATPAARVTRSLTQAWGMLFGAAEKYNRHVAFIAAWEVAPEGVDRYEFAKNAVTETQFDYTKASRPNWARGAVGATLFTFKTFSINYVEFMSRLPPRERAIALVVLFLLAGMSGMPGADDLDDVVDTVAQKMGYNWNNAAARHAWLVRTLGTGGADFVERGVSSALPLDVSARLGMGNLVPGTGVLQKSNTSPVRDVQEFFGPAGSVVAGFRDVFDNAGSGKGVVDTALPLMPKMFKDLRQAVDMVQTGQYRDMKGRKVVDVDGVDAVIKGIGFQPNSVASPRRVERMLAQSAGMQRVIRQDISELWARGVAEQDAEKVASARTILREWNEKNPESKITMNPTSIAQRVRAMRLTSADRLVKATPKDMRGALAAEMAVQQ